MGRLAHSAYTTLDCDKDLAMILHWKKEGQTVGQGLSFYHPKDEHSFGFVLRIGNRMWRMRYSKFAKKWFTGYDKIDPNALKNWEKLHGLKHE
jgi:hypothetical protein